MEGLPGMEYAMHVALLAHSYSYIKVLKPSVLWCCWPGGRKGIQPVK